MSRTLPRPSSGKLAIEDSNIGVATVRKLRLGLNKGEIIRSLADPQNVLHLSVQWRGGASRATPDTHPMRRQVAEKTWVGCNFNSANSAFPRKPAACACVAS